MTVRFWRRAAPAAPPGGAGWTVMLDDKPLRLPSGAVLALATEALAGAVAAEWHNAGGEIGGKFGTHDIRLTGLAGAAQERIRPQRAAMLDTLAAYGACDLLCYRAVTPRALADRQASEWQPWLDWAALRHGATLEATTAIAQVVQPPASLAALRAALAALSDEALAALGLAIPALGSCVLGLALAERAAGAAEMVSLGCLDELYQQEQWGVDAEATARRAGLHDDIVLAERFMELSDQGRRRDVGGRGG